MIKNTPRFNKKFWLLEGITAISMIFFINHLETTVQADPVAPTVSTINNVKDDQQSNPVPNTPTAPQTPTPDSTKDVQNTVNTDQTQTTPQPVLKTTGDQPAPDTPDINTWMPNKSLQQLVLQSLNYTDDYNNHTMLNDQTINKTWNSTADITQNDMQLLDNLDDQTFKTDTYIDGKTSYSLEGLQYATNLTKLDLSDNINLDEPHLIGDITDVSPLKNLTN
jgi:hypothetical protein